MITLLLSELFKIVIIIIIDKLKSEHKMFFIPLKGKILKT